MPSSCSAGKCSSVQPAFASVVFSGIVPNVHVVLGVVAASFGVAARVEETNPYLAGITERLRSLLGM